MMNRDRWVRRVYDMKWTELDLAEAENSQWKGYLREIKKDNRFIVSGTWIKRKPLRIHKELPKQLYIQPHFMGKDMFNLQPRTSQLKLDRGDPTKYKVIDTEAAKLAHICFRLTQSDRWEIPYLPVDFPMKTLAAYKLREKRKRRQEAKQSSSSVSPLTS